MVHKQLRWITKIQYINITYPQIQTFYRLTSGVHSIYNSIFLLHDSSLLKYPKENNCLFIDMFP